MEFPCSLLLTFLLLLLIAIIAKLGKESTSKLPPGPWKLPIIGSLHHLMNGSPHHIFRDLAKKHGPLMHLQLGEVSTVVISSSDMVKKVMVTHGLTFANRPLTSITDIIIYGSSDVVFTPYGNYWREMRKIFVSEILGVKHVPSFRCLREEEVSNLIENISSSVAETGNQAGLKPINISQKIFSLVYDIMAKAAFGEKFKDLHILLPLLQEFSVLASGNNLTDYFPSRKFLYAITGIKPKIEKLHREIDSLLEGVIRDHIEKKKRAHRESGKNLLDVLLRVQKAGNLDFPITNDNIKALILDMFIAGSDTTATLLEWIMSELIKNPSVMEKVQAEVRQVFNGKLHIDETEIPKLSYLKLVIKETLRLHPPGPLLVPRESRERCEIDGYEIPKKTQLIVNMWAISTDDKYWDDPEEFRPERFNGTSIDYKGANFELIPFGAGRRICPAVDFTVAIIELPLARLLYHFNWKLPGDFKPEELDMKETFGATVRKTNELYLIPNLSNNLSAGKND